MIERPIFIIGAERSGTTMLRLMLDHHPKISFLSEFEYAVEHVILTDRWPSLDLYYRQLSTDRIFQSHGFTINRDLCYTALVDDFLRQKRDRDGKPMVGATLHRGFDRVMRIWPDARFVRIVRDGRDVARSCIGMGWAGNVWSASRRWIEAEQLWDDCEATITPDRYIDLRYEALVEQPIEILSQVCEFLDVAYDEAMVRYPETTTYDAPDASLSYQWKRKMSPYQIRLTEARMGNMLVQRGYDLSGLESLRVNSILKSSLRLQDRIARWRFRVRRYGPWLLATNVLIRHLGVSAWKRQIKCRMNAIDGTAAK